MRSTPQARPIRSLPSGQIAAAAAASRLRFFHWELEFPEVYFGTDGKSLGDKAGFDAVVGNPPYVRQEELDKLQAVLCRRFTQKPRTALPTCLFTSSARACGS